MDAEVNSKSRMKSGTRMTARQQFFALAEAHGVEASYDAGRKRHPRTGEPVEYGMMLDHPTKIFAGSGCHCDGSLGGAAWEVTPDWERLVHQLKQIIAEGFADCDDPDCDICNGA